MRLLIYVALVSPPLLHAALPVVPQSQLTGARPAAASAGATGMKSQTTDIKPQVETQTPTGTPALSPEAPPPQVPSPTAAPAQGQAPTGQPTYYSQYDVQRPNLGKDKKKNDQAIQQTMQQLMGAMGAPQKNINGKPNPNYDREMDDFAGGSAYDGRYGPAVNNGDYRKALSSCDISDPARLKNHTCNPNDRDRLACMVCNIYYEALNEPNEGQVAVGKVTMARAFNGGFPPTVCGVVYEKKNGSKTAQFSWTVEPKNHTLPNGGAAFDRVVRSAIQALQEGPGPYSNYWNPNIANPPWGRGGECAKTSQDIANHRFCAINATPTRRVAEVLNAEGCTNRGGKSGNGGGDGNPTTTR